VTIQNSPLFFFQKSNSHHFYKKHFKERYETLKAQIIITSLSVVALKTTTGRQKRENPRNPTLERERACFCFSFSLKVRRCSEREAIELRSDFEISILRRDFPFVLSLAFTK